MWWERLKPKNALAEFGRWWRRRQRAIDLAILWPSCCQQSINIEAARDAFYYHVIIDDTWTADYSDGELLSIVASLQPKGDER